MEQSVSFDLIVIGAGSGGMAAARRAAAYGARVLVVEHGPLGGTCVNVGCVPKKVMWNAARIGSMFELAPAYGFSLDTASHDWGKLVAARQQYVRRLNDIYRRNLAVDGVELVEGTAEIVSSESVRVGARTFHAEHLLIATGGRPRIPDVPGAELGVTSDGFFAWQERPARVAIAGAGYIAVEVAGVLRALGSEVDLVIRHQTVLRHFDALLSNELMAAMERDGIRIHTDSVIERVERDGTGRRLQCAGGHRIGPVDALIWAIGRIPNSDVPGIDRLALEIDAAGHIVVDEFQNTSVERVYAVGDVTPAPALTPVAIRNGRKLADRLFGGRPDAHNDARFVPTVIFSHPPIGAVGLSEREAIDRYGADAVHCYESRFVNMLYAPADHKPMTAMRLVTVGERREVVGLHVIGEGADEMVQGFAVAMEMGATKADFDRTIAIHPTAAEEFVTMR
ncbi:MAG: glutathione-disulfide reductase [Candidatus Dadabacteria bacterium]|nr:MAG: glutathione-disulfide reductase [Candidatus Dadabacteria bacterium]